MVLKSVRVHLAGSKSAITSIRSVGRCKGMGGEEADETDLRAMRASLGPLGAFSPNVKIQGSASAFWSGFDTSELRVQLTSAHTRALIARASRIVSRSQRYGDGAKKEHAPSLEPRFPALKGVGGL